MKSILAAVMFLAIVLTGGTLYWFVRKPDAKKKDRQKLTGVFHEIVNMARSLWSYVTKLFAAGEPTEIEKAAA